MRIPRTLDRPTRLLGIPFDLVMMGLCTYYLFVLCDSGVLGIPVAIIVGNIYSRFRSRTLLRNFQRIIYWYLPYELSRGSSVPGHIRRIKFSESEYDKD
ncbi:MAG: type IV conjugative transfer system protein TraL [Rickettsiales bacterium]